MLVILSGSLVIIGFLLSEMTLLVDLATTLSFLTAPILVYINNRVVTGNTIRPQFQPQKWLRILSWICIFFLGCISVLFLWWGFGQGMF
jgi:tryptophan-rich sensory protein